MFACRWLRSRSVTARASRWRAPRCSRAASAAMASARRPICCRSSSTKSNAFISRVTSITSGGSLRRWLRDRVMRPVLRVSSIPEHCFRAARAHHAFFRAIAGRRHRLATRRGAGRAFGAADHRQRRTGHGQDDDGRRRARVSARRESEPAHRARSTHRQGRATHAGSADRARRFTRRRNLAARLPRTSFTLQRLLGTQIQWSFPPSSR